MLAWSLETLVDFNELLASSSRSAHRAGAGEGGPGVGAGAPGLARTSSTVVNLQARAHLGSYKIYFQHP